MKLRQTVSGEWGFLICINVMDARVIIFPAHSTISWNANEMITGAEAVLSSKRWQELLAFLALAFGIWPIVAVGVVGGYGFAVWMWQVVFGPPGPPTG